MTELSFPLYQAPSTCQTFCLVCNHQEGADWFHWTGITPAISASAAEVCLEACQAANRLGVTVSCDLNFRKNLWKYGKTAAEVMPALVECCDVILGNEEDAEKVFGIKPCATITEACVPRACALPQEEPLQ